MKSCSIIPPSEVLELYGESGDEKEACAVDPMGQALEAICMKALAKRPEDRSQTCRAYWDDLHAFIEAKEAVQRPVH